MFLRWYHRTEFGSATEDERPDVERTARFVRLQQTGEHCLILNESRQRTGMYSTFARIAASYGKREQSNEDFGRASAVGWDQNALTMAPKNISSGTSNKVNYNSNDGR